MLLKTEKSIKENIDLLYFYIEFLNFNYEFINTTGNPMSMQNVNITNFLENKVR